MSPVTLSLLLWSVTAAAAGSCVVGVWRVVALLGAAGASLRGIEARGIETVTLLTLLTETYPERVTDWNGLRGQLNAEIRERV